MILTCEEAQKKYCCNTHNTGQHCVVSNCMAWRWYSTVAEHIYEDKKFPSLPEIKKTIYKPKDEWTGYCGLAGQP